MNQSRPAWSAAASRLVLLVALFAGSGALGADVEEGPGRAGHQLRFAVETSLELPEAVREVKDVRWGDGDAILIARFLDGTARFDPESGDLRTLVPGGGGQVPRMHGRLARAAGRLAVASPVFEIGVFAGGSTSRGPFFVHVDDLDLSGQRLAVLGGRRDDEGIPEPGIAWLVDLSGEADERILVRSRDSRRGPWPIDSCGAWELGAVRFLPGGDLVVVPGVEPDVYLFDREGRLKRTWPTQPSAIAGECDLDAEQVQRLAQDEEGRWRWINQRRTVDEIVPLPGGDVGLIVRDPVAGDGVRWELVRLGRDGSRSTSPLPFQADTDRAFLRADVRHGRAVVLIGQWWSRDTAVDQAPRLLIGRFEKAAG